MGRGQGSGLKTSRQALADRARQSMSKQIPEKAVRKQAALIIDILGETIREVELGVPADSTLARVYRSHPEYGSRDRSFFSETVFSFFRWRGWTEAFPTLSSDRRKAAVVAHLLDAGTVHPAVAQLAKDAGLPPRDLAPLSQLDLRAKAVRLAEFLSGSPPSPAQLAPAWIRDAICGADEKETAAFLNRIFDSFQSRPPTWLRIRCESRDKALAILNEAGIQTSPHPVLSSALAVTPGVNLRGLAPQLAGLVEVQDLASQAAGIVCAPEPGSSWWDACCGSGGKTLHLADLMHGRGRILATDVRGSTLEQLNRRMRRDVSPRPAALRWDGSRDPAPAGPFDGVLLDAPCSGMGTWHRNPDARWRMTPQRVAELAELQAILLRKCASQVRPGGALVYATCTMTHAENEAVARSFTETSPDFAPARFAHPLDGSPCAGQMKIHPWDGPCNGMFVARWTRSL